MFFLVVAPKNLVGKAQRLDDFDSWPVSSGLNSINIALQYGDTHHTSRAIFSIPRALGFQGLVQNCTVRYFQDYLGDADLALVVYVDISGNMCGPILN